MIVRNGPEYRGHMKTTFPLNMKHQFACTTKCKTVEREIR